jgi:hypothetical protein
MALLRDWSKNARRRASVVAARPRLRLTPAAPAVLLVHGVVARFVEMPPRRASAAARPRLRPHRAAPAVLLVHGVVARFVEMPAGERPSPPPARGCA